MDARASRGKPSPVVLCVHAQASSQVRTLIGDYVMDEEQGAVSGRNPISSINEVLREGKFTRDKTKVSLVLLIS